MIKNMSSFAKVLCVLFICLTIVSVAAMFTGNLNTIISAFTFPKEWWELLGILFVIVLFGLLS